MLTHHTSVIIRGALVVAVFLSWGCSKKLSGPVTLTLPKGVAQPFIPGDNPLTKGKVMLGRKLYFDKRLSTDNTVSCATCHHPDKGFADGKPVGEGIHGKKGARNSPSTLNAAFYDVQFWDGRAKTLEDQAIGPMINPVEMAMPSHDDLVKKLRGIPEYRELFSQVFGTRDFTIEQVGQAIASFERTLIAFDSPFDRFLAGDSKAISESAQRGWTIFLGKGMCNICHTYASDRPFFTDNKFHNIGVGVTHTRYASLSARAEKGEDPSALKAEEGVSELGRYMVSRKAEDIGAFKTPGLRNIALSPPYMHDGSESTLTAVVEYYNRGGNKNPRLDKDMKPLGLTKDEVKDLIAFMESLTSSGIDAMRKDFSADLK